MAFDPINESYDRCIAELRARYHGRGVSANFKNEAGKIAEKENKALSEGAGSYVLFDSRSMIGDSYRSGEYNGSKYMTSDDFVRYFKNRRSFYSMQSALKSASDAEAESAARTGVPARRGKSRGGELSADSGKEGHLSTLTSVIKELASKFFPLEAKEGRIEGKKMRLPVSAMAGVAVFTLSLGLIVSGSVMIGSASGELGRVESEITALEAKQDELQSDLDLRYDINELEADAKELGMVKREYADNVYIEAEGNEGIVAYDEEEEKDIGLVALLSGFGIKLNK